MQSTQTSLQQLRRQQTQADSARKEAELRLQAMQVERDNSQRERDTALRERDRLRQDRDQLSRWCVLNLRSLDVFVGSHK